MSEVQFLSLQGNAILPLLPLLAKAPLSGITSCPALPHVPLCLKSFRK